MDTEFNVYFFLIQNSLVDLLAKMNSADPHFVR